MRQPLPEDKRPITPKRKAPPPALLFLPITMSKNQNHPAIADNQTPGHIDPVMSAIALKSTKPATPPGAALGEGYIGARRPGCQAMSGKIPFGPEPSGHLHMDFTVPRGKGADAAIIGLRANLSLCR